MGDVPHKPEGIQRALLIGVEKVKGFADLPQAHKDVANMRDFLVNFRGYRPENIVIMMHHKSVLPKLYPSRVNIVSIHYLFSISHPIVECSCERSTL